VIVYLTVARDPLTATLETSALLCLASGERDWAWMTEANVPPFWSSLIFCEAGVEPSKNAVQFCSICALALAALVLWPPPQPAAGSSSPTAGSSGCCRGATWRGRSRRRRAAGARRRGRPAVIPDRLTTRRNRSILGHVDLYEVMRLTGQVRAFLPDPVPDEAV